MEILIPANIIQDFHFLRPMWLLALIPAITFIGAMWRVNNNVTAWDKAIDKKLLPFLLDRSKNAAQRTPLSRASRIRGGSKRGRTELRHLRLPAQNGRALGAGSLGLRPWLHGSHTCDQL